MIFPRYNYVGDNYWDFIRMSSALIQPNSNAQPSENKKHDAANFEEKKLKFTPLPSIHEFFRDADFLITSPTVAIPQDGSTISTSASGFPQVYVSQSRGPRPYQEDRYCMLRIAPEFLSLLEQKQIDAAFATALTDVDAQIKDEAQGGSTACVLRTTPTPNGVIATSYSVADSQAFAVNVSADEKKAAIITPLNRELAHLGPNSSNLLHRVHLDAKDKKIFEHKDNLNNTAYFRKTYDDQGQESKNVSFWLHDRQTPNKGTYRLANSGLNMGNSIGDPYSKACGKGCDVEIKQYTFEVDANNTLVFLVVSDGVPEVVQNPLDAKGLSPITTVTERAIRSGQHLAERIILNTPGHIYYDTEHKQTHQYIDNRTCIGTVFRNNELKTAQPTAMAVFDGHGSFATAEILRKSYFFLVKAKLYRMALENQYQAGQLSEQEFHHKIVELTQYLISKITALTEQLQEQPEYPEVIAITKHLLLQTVNLLPAHNNADLLSQLVTLNFETNPDLSDEKELRNFSQEILNKFISTALNDSSLGSIVNQNQRIFQEFDYIWEQIKYSDYNAAQNQTLLTDLLNYIQNNLVHSDPSRASEIYTDLVSHIVISVPDTHLTLEAGSDLVLEALENEVAILNRNNDNADVNNIANRDQFFPHAITNTFNRLLQFYQVTPLPEQKQRLSNALKNCIKTIEVNGAPPELVKTVATAFNKSRLACFGWICLTIACILLTLIAAAAAIAAFAAANIVTSGVLSFMAPIYAKFLTIGLGLFSAYVGKQVFHNKVLGNWTSTDESAIRGVMEEMAATPPPQPSANMQQAHMPPVPLPKAYCGTVPVSRPQHINAIHAQ